MTDAPTLGDVLDAHEQPPADKRPNAKPRSGSGSRKPNAAGAKKAPTAKLGDKRPGAKPRGPGRPRKTELRDDLRDGIEKIAGSLILAGTLRDSPTLRYDGEVLATNADALARELFDLADANPAIRRALESLFRATDWARMMGVAASVAVPILANHGVLPPATATMVGAPAPPPRPERKPKGKRGDKSGAPSGEAVVPPAPEGAPYPTAPPAGVVNLFDTSGANGDGGGR